MKIYLIWSINARDEIELRRYQGFFIYNCLSTLHKTVFIFELSWLIYKYLIHSRVGIIDMKSISVGYLYIVLMTQ